MAKNKTARDYFGDVLRPEIISIALGVAGGVNRGGEAKRERGRVSFNEFTANERKKRTIPPLLSGSAASPPTIETVERKTSDKSDTVGVVATASPAVASISSWHWKAPWLPLVGNWSCWSSDLDDGEAMND